MPHTRNISDPRLIIELVCNLPRMNYKLSPAGESFSGRIDPASGNRFKIWALSYISNPILRATSGPLWEETYRTMALRSSIALSVQISLKSRLQLPPGFLVGNQPSRLDILFRLAERCKEGDLIRNSLVISIIWKTLYRLQNRFLHRHERKIVRFGSHRKAS